MPDWMLAAGAGLASAAALEVLRHVLARVQKATEKQMDDATSFRHDLLGRIAALEEDVAQSNKERNEWMDRYYVERELRTKAQWQLEGQAQTLAAPDLMPSITAPQEEDGASGESQSGSLTD